MKRLYQVEGNFSYQEKNLSPEMVRTAFVKAIKRVGLSDINFEINISRIKINNDGQVGQEEIEHEEVKIELPKKKRGRPKKDKIEKSKKGKVKHGKSRKKPMH